jgi:YidC/Oxa1 family membrane protein insertase
VDVINTILGIPLGYIFYFCYELIPHYGLAILVFTLATKLLLFPLSLIAQKNSIVMVRIQPALDEIKQRFAGNSTLVLAEQKALYKREHYSMVKGMLPLLLQIPIILGLICVIYNPLQHLLHLDVDTIRSLVALTAQNLGVSPEELGTGAQLAVMELAHSNPAVFAADPVAAPALPQMAAVDLDFLGVSMAMVPNFAATLTLAYPLLSGLSALALCVFQNKYNVLQLTQGFWGKWGTALFLTAFSLYFAFVLPCGVGLYWIAGNLLSMLTLALCNLIYDPKKHLDFATLTQTVRPSRVERAALRAQRTTAKARERQDVRRFYKESDKQLVFYSESSGFFKYFSRIITWLLQNSDLTIHYVTSDTDDQVFSCALSSRLGPRFKTYYVGPRGLISFMMRLDADIVVMTMPDLEVFHIKRSLVRKDIEYIYLDHGMTSLHLALREHALDHFDTLFVNGPNHRAEARRAEELYELPAKTLVNTGYPLLDDLLESVARLPFEYKNTPPIALIAPSWQKDNILELCPNETVLPLLEAGFKVIVRPHPEFAKRFSNKLDDLQQELEEKIAASPKIAADPKTAVNSKTVASPELVFERDFSDNTTVYLADIVVTDWSTVAQEFSYATKKPSLFVNTPMKVINPRWQDLDLEPLDISLRESIGRSIDVENLADIGTVARELLAQREHYREQISNVMNTNLYNIGHAAETAGGYIVERAAAAANRRADSQAQLERELAAIKGGVGA